jgi:hypothetical protein
MHMKKPLSEPACVSRFERHKDQGVVVVRNCLAAILLLCTFGAHSAPKHTLFVPIRASLIKQGWRPFQLHRTADASYPSDTEEGRLVQKFHELESCSVDAGMLCRFWYVRDRQCLLVVTRGEHLKSMRAIYQKPASCPE